MRRSSILIAHPWLENGGSEATTMWAVRALQEKYDVSLVTAGNLDLRFLENTFGAGVEAEGLSLIRAPRLPLVRSGSDMVALQHALFHRFCRKLAVHHDLCISAYNFIPFGKPGIQLVGDFSFSESLRRQFYLQGFQRFRHRKTMVRKAYLALSDALSGNPLPFHQRGDLVLANSRWTARQLDTFCQLEGCDILYPPVPAPEPVLRAPSRNPLGFFYIGRVSPEKEVEEIISILDLVRQKGFPVTLDLAGNRHLSEYERLIGRMSRERDWIRDLGYLSGSEKQEAFARNAFSIHACKCEAFGIAVAESSMRGCLPVVPGKCGPAEIVPFSDLHYQTVDEAVRKIVHLLRNPALTEALRKKAGEESYRFRTAEFVSGLRRHVGAMLESTRRDAAQSPVRQAPERPCAAIFS